VWNFSFLKLNPNHWTNLKSCFGETACSILHSVCVVADLSYQADPTSARRTPRRCGRSTPTPRRTDRETRTTINCRQIDRVFRRHRTSPSSPLERYVVHTSRALPVSEAPARVETMWPPRLIPAARPSGNNPGCRQARRTEASAGVSTVDAVYVQQTLSRDYNCDSTTTQLRSDYDVSRAPASSSTQAKNEYINFSS